MINTSGSFGVLDSVINKEDGVMNILKADYYNSPLERFLSQKLNNTSFSVLPVVCENTVTLEAGHGANE